MTAPTRLVAFAVALTLLFGVAVAAGSALGPDRDGDRSAAGREDGHAGGEDGAHAAEPTGGAAPDADAVRGLAVSHDGLTLSLQETDLPRDRPAVLTFSVDGPDGRPVRDFEVEHERRMHLIVVRRDGHGFQHLHPELGEDGRWRTTLTVPDAGAYRVFADFSREGEAWTLAADLVVDGPADYRPLPPATATTTTEDGYTVSLAAGQTRAGQDAKLRFTVTRDGRTVHTEPYLGAGGHLVALREGDLAYLHVHPGGTVPTRTPRPTTTRSRSSARSRARGRYGLYLQFKHDGRVHTAAFTREVVR
jgi:hypothetical protein